MALALVTVAAPVAWSACGASDDEVRPGLRREMLRETVDVVILPTYRTLAERAELLAAAASGFQVAPDAVTLEAAREAWRVARRVWKQSEAFRFGPSEDVNLRFRNKIDWTPASPQRIEEEIAGSAELTPEYIDSIGVPRRGFGALEYLLFDLPEEDGVALEQLMGQTGARRRAYLAAVAADLALQSRHLLEAWDPMGGDFRGQLITAGQGSATYAAVKAAVDDLANAFVVLAATLQEKQLGPPAGLMPAGPAQPELIELVRSGSALADVADNLQSFANVYDCRYGGATGVSVSRVVAAVSPDIDAAIRFALDRARRTVAAIPPPLTAAVIEHPAEVARAYEAMRDLRLAFAVDLTSALGATPRIVGDGD
jgi:predicted lipoprotein